MWARSLKQLSLIGPGTHVALEWSREATHANLLKYLRNYFAARFRAEIAFAVHAHTDRVRFQVAFSDDEHCVHFHLFGALNLAIDLVGTLIDLRADLVRAQFIEN